MSGLSECERAHKSVLTVHWKRFGNELQVGKVVNGHASLRGWAVVCSAVKRGEYTKFVSGYD